MTADKKSAIADEIINIHINAEDNNSFRQRIYILLDKYDVKEKTTEIAVRNETEEERVLRMFFVSKKVEGLSERSLAYYKTVLNTFFTKCQKGIFSATSDDIKVYLAYRGMRDKVSKVTQDNERRILNSFFGWASDENYITKNPVRSVRAIKKDKIIKKPFSEIEMEKIRREAAKNKRDIALIDFLYSTGARCEETSRVNIEDINGDEVRLFGKGNKERIAYLNAKARMSISEYLEERTDNEKALFVSISKPHQRIHNGGIETRIRKIGEAAGVENAHPHRFRRTCATRALNRGMPLEEVSQMLGHENIETTTIYARSERENVKASHRKYVV